MKKCFKCKKEQELSMFYKHKGMSDGHLGKCKTCTKNDANKHRQENLEKVREYDRNRPNKKDRAKKQAIYHSFGKGRDIATKSNQKYRNTNPLRYKANCIVNNAIRNGRLVRPIECSCCGIKCKPHGHHDDYSKPLDVRWLCSKCHNDFHRNAREMLRKDGTVSSYMIT